MCTKRRRQRLIVREELNTKALEFNSSRTIKGWRLRFVQIRKKSSKNRALNYLSTTSNLISLYLLKTLFSPSRLFSTVWHEVIGKWELALKTWGQNRIYLKSLLLQTNVQSKNL